LSSEFFIARKLIKSEVQGKKVSRPIVRISIISISLAIVVNLITLAVVKGFQQEVRHKITGFGSHFFIKAAGDASPYETEPIQINHPAFQQLKSLNNIRGVFPVAYKPALIQAKETEKKIKLSTGKDSLVSKQDILGVIFKGLSGEHHWDFFRQNLVEGKIPDFKRQIDVEPVLISKKTASLLNYKLKDTLDAFFVRQSPVKRQFVIAGIYSTGLEEFDKKLVLTNLPIVQELNDWGLNASIRIADTLSNGSLIMNAEISGGNGSNLFDWGRGFERFAGIVFCPKQDTTIRLITRSISMGNGQRKKDLIDTSFLKIKVQGNPNCEFQLNENGELDREYLDQIGNHFKINCTNESSIEFQQIDGKSTSLNFISGYEVTLTDWNELDLKANELKQLVELIPYETGELLEVNSIKETEKELFIWLGFLDINVLIIIVLMLLIGTINMGSAMLVLIVVRTNFIGMMKAMGATNWTIRKIFLIQAGFLILRGMFWGNLIGIGLCLLQKYFGLINLNPEVYYLSQVPIELDIWHFILLNLGTLIICLMALIIPSFVITKINPVRAIRFD
jgi:lipoprotein-releasing system permease protein